MCEHNILSQKGQTLISRCQGCKTTKIWQHNLLLSFTKGQFLAFKNFTSQINAAEAMFPFPDGEDRFVMRTPNMDISFAFTGSEWEDFGAAMEEAVYMIGIYDMLSEHDQ